MEQVPVKSTSAWRSLLFALLPLLILGCYWYSTRPTLPHHPWAEDMCNHDMARQLMAEQLAVHGAPVFRFDGVMAPFGIEAPFYAGWNIERDWIGARIWAWDRDFPFYWWEFGISLLLCYSISGFLLRRMGLGTVAAWTIALCIAGFNVPRHLKLWHHSDNVMLHWAWAGFLLDALIWQRFIRERRISIHLEAWRGVMLAGMLWTKQYFYYDVDKWLDEHQRTPEERKKLRNAGWFHMLNDDIISMPDKWEYPWYAAWDLAFHMLPLAAVDHDFAKSQLDLMPVSYTHLTLPTNREV